MPTRDTAIKDMCVARLSGLLLLFSFYCDHLILLILLLLLYFIIIIIFIYLLF